MPIKPNLLLVRLLEHLWFEWAVYHFLQLPLQRDWFLFWIIARFLRFWTFHCFLERNFILETIRQDQISCRYDNRNHQGYVKFLHHLGVQHRGSSLYIICLNEHKQWKFLWFYWYSPWILQIGHGRLGLWEFWWALAFVLVHFIDFALPIDLDEPLDSLDGRHLLKSAGWYHSNRLSVESLASLGAWKYHDMEQKQGHSTVYDCLQRKRTWGTCRKWRWRLAQTNQGQYLSYSTQALQPEKTLIVPIFQPIIFALKLKH